METRALARRERALGRREFVNDVHSRLNPTLVREVVPIASLEDLRRAIERAARDGTSISVAGGRHAMGGQAFGTDALLLDTRPMRRVLEFDSSGGRIRVEAGILWPELIARSHELQGGARSMWGIAQKQTGADRLSLGGALSANIHGRGLTMHPVVGDVESLCLVDARGEAHECDRTENAELFRLAIGGYGLFGPIHALTLRLAPRTKIRRVVEVFASDELIPAFQARIEEGCLYGDFQFAIDPMSADFLRLGVFACYHPVDPTTPIRPEQRRIEAADWMELLYLAHSDKARAFRRYADYYRSTSGQIYWSDAHQLGIYLDDYHETLDRRLGRGERASEIITEVYVPPEDLLSFLDDVREDLRRRPVDLIYGTIRMVRRDEETFLAWARRDYACIVFNLHTVHSPEGIERSRAAIRRLIDIAIAHGGSFYLTYHRFATRRQVETCYPRFRDFLAAKLRHDPDERFQSDWYRHYRGVFGRGED